jgi:hypothetical protein
LGLLTGVAQLVTLFQCTLVFVMLLSDEYEKTNSTYEYWFGFYTYSVAPIHAHSIMAVEIVLLQSFFVLQ